MAQSRFVRIYLICYNVIMSFLFLTFIWENIESFYENGGPQNSKNWFKFQVLGQNLALPRVKKFYTHTGSAVNLALILACLEPVHGILGFSKTNIVMSIAQNFGRGILTIFIYLNSKNRESPFIFYLFLVWSIGDLMRYPYYTFTLLKIDSKILKFFRYHSFMVLYPFGCILEVVAYHLCFKPMFVDGASSSVGKAVATMYLYFISFFTPVAVMNLMGTMFKQRNKAYAKVKAQ